MQCFLEKKAMSITVMINNRIFFIFYQTDSFYYFLQNLQVAKENVPRTILQMIDHYF